LGIRADDQPPDLLDELFRNFQVVWGRLKKPFDDSPKTLRTKRITALMHGGGPASLFIAALEAKMGPIGDVAEQLRVLSDALWEARQQATDEATARAIRGAESTPRPKRTARGAR
jgi:hypothetical protein